MSELVVAQRGEERGFAGQLQELDGRDGPAAGRLRPGAVGVEDLTGVRHALDPQELDPLDMTDDPDAHARESLIDQTPDGPMDAVLLACLAAFGFGALAVAVRVGFRRFDEPLLAALCISVVGCAAVAAVAAASGALGSLRLADAAVFLGIGALVPGLSQLLFVRAVRDAGPSRASIAIGTAPIFSAALAVAFLGETLGPTLAIATLLIVAGGALLAWEPVRPAGFRAIGVVLGVVCAVLFAVRDNLVREAAERGELEPLAATTASLLGAVLVLGLVALATRVQAGGPVPVRTVAAAFAPAGVCLGLAYAALIEAFDRGQVTVVAPLNATQSLWAVALSAIVLGRSEAIGRRLVLAAVLVVAGGALIGVTR